MMTCSPCRTSNLLGFLLALATCLGWERMVEAFVLGPSFRRKTNDWSFPLLSERPDDAEASGSFSKIPQLPAAASRSSQASSPCNATAAEDVRPFVASRKFQLSYTCNICEKRNEHFVSRIAYNNGVVICTCKGCDAQHLIADHLGWTDYDGGFQGSSTNTIEDYYDDGVVNRVSQEVYSLENILKSHDTASGSIVGDNGEPALE